MIRAIITGVAGRMGSLLVRAVRDSDGFQLVGATEQPGSASVGLDAGLAAGLGMLEVPVCDNLGKALQLANGADVVIDFTHYKASVAHAEVCAEQKVSLVVGSTGFTPEARDRIAKCAKDIPIVMSPNMSVGVNLMIRVAGELAKVLGSNYDVEILDLHHRQKVDAPSGTALRLAEVVADTLGRDRAKDVVTSRTGAVGERPRRQIGVQSLRGGDAVGEHTVYFLGAGERLELTHRATSRDGFATGAVRAARWLSGRPPGLYSMQDVLGLK
jgi:4-hydroxy-tetrahydrodipicolinate reductase